MNITRITIYSKRTGERKELEKNAFSLKDLTSVLQLPFPTVKK